MVGSHKLVGSSYVHTENSQMTSIGAIFTSTYYIKSMAKLISQLWGELQLAFCLSREDAAI